MRDTSAHPREYAQLRTLDGLKGVEVLRAQFQTHRFATHSHDTWAFGAVVLGAQDNAPGPNGGNVVRRSEITVLRPGQAHAGRALGGDPCRYVMIYVPDTMVRRVAETSGRTEPHFSQRAILDGRMAARLASFVATSLAAPSHAECLVPDMGFELETIIAELIARHGRTRAPEDKADAARSDPRLRHAHELLHSQIGRPVALRRLAEEIGLSPFHLCRRFAQVYGLPPHRYHLILRLRRAKTLITAGGHLADVALATGFADQSHLGRHFKECFGCSPGGLRRPRRAAMSDRSQ